MPRYEFTEGSSNKFWEITLAGPAYTSKWGRIGGSFSTSTKSHPDAATARREHDKLIAEKLKKGYLLVGGKEAKPGKAAKPGKPDKPAAPAGPPRNKALEKAILADPDDPEPYLVYADWMQANGELRGELAVLQHAGKGKEAGALLRKHGAWFLGDFAKQKPPVFQLEWACGFIKSATIGWSSFEENEDDEGEDTEVHVSRRCAQKLRAFLNLPSAMFIQELVLGPVPGDGDTSLEGLAKVVAERMPPCLRVLELGDTGDWDISAVSTAMPDSKAIRGLRSLKLRGGNVGLGTIDLPELRAFTVESGGLGRGELKKIANAKWPKLEKLEIWCGEPRYGASGSAKDLAPILAATGLSKLRHLGIRNCAFADEVAKTLIKSKLLPQLETLDLSMGNLSDRGVELMAASKDAFKHLAKLELDDNALTEASKPRLKGLAKKVSYGRQDSPERAVPRTEDNEGERYVAVGE